MYMTLDEYITAHFIKEFPFLRDDYDINQLPPVPLLAEDDFEESEDE